ncbi:MAG: transcriptional regulator [Lachnospiraceae bacterium]|nr:transcriptional regulator [Lachnospiraceae bacterium]
MDLREQLIALRKGTGMNKKQFAEYFGIPYRTFQDWELGNRTMPEYLLRLMVYKIQMERRLEQEEASGDTG